MMGQELDSLADLVRAMPLHKPPTYPNSHSAHPQTGRHKADRGKIQTDLIRRRSSRRCFRHWHPHPPGSSLSRLLCALWIDAPSALQCHSEYNSQGCYRKGGLFRGNTHSHHAGARRPHGVVGLAGVDPRCDTWRRMVCGDRRRGAPRGPDIHGTWVLDDEQNYTCPEAVGDLDDKRQRAGWLAIAW